MAPYISSLGFQNFLKDALTIVKVSDHHIILVLLLAFGAAATAFGGLLLLSNCMKRYDATFSAAMFVGSFVVSASIMSAIHYDTFQHLDFIHTVLYLAGLSSIIAGVWVLIVDNDQVRYSKPEDEYGVETAQQEEASKGHPIC